MGCINVEFWWQNYSGYAASCWKSLHAQEHVNLAVVAACSAQANIAPFDASLLTGLPIQLAGPNELRELVQRRAADTSSRVLVVSGWVNPVFRKHASTAKASGAKLLLALDNPWCGTWKQRAARLLLYNYLSLFSAAVVPGERAWQYARHLGFTKRPIYKGLYGIDAAPLDTAAAARHANQVWPKAFLFVGRLSPEKGIDTLKLAYEEYRRSSKNPWPLNVVGEGPLRSRLEGVKGIHLHGFVQPQEMGKLWISNGVFVLPSNYDPWPLVVVEACRSGLPVIHSTACGSPVELVREGYNGFAFETDNSNRLAQLLMRAEREYSNLPDYGNRSIELARPYDADHWAKHWKTIATSVLQLP